MYDNISSSSPHQPSHPPPRKCLDSNLKLLTISGLIMDGKGVWITRVLVILFIIFYSLVLINLVLVMRQISAGEKVNLGVALVRQCYDLLLTLILFLDFTFFVYRVYPILPELQQLFDKMDPNIRRQCDAKERNIYWFTFVVIGLGAFLCYAKRTIEGLSPEEIQLAANSALKANPSKQLPFLVWLPVDDTVQPTYTILFGYNMLFLGVNTLFAFHIFGYFQMISIHIKGYCETISLPLDQLGKSKNLTQSKIQKQECLNMPMNPDITSPSVDQYWDLDTTKKWTEMKSAKNIKPFSKRTQTTTKTSLKLCTEQWRSEHSIEMTPKTLATSAEDSDIVILKTFIKQHRQFLESRAKFQESIKLSILFTNSIYNLILTFSLIRLYTTKYEDLNQISQTILQYAIIVMMSFSFYLSSETVDDGNDIIYKALAANHWYLARPDVVRLLVPILMVTQRPKRFMYFGGTVDVCFRSFLSVVKFSYSLFTIFKNVIECH